MSVELDRAAFPAASGAANDIALQKLHTTFSVLLVAIVALAPIPLGSNRPAFWTLWAVAIGILAAAYGLALLRLRVPARRPLGAYRLELTCFALVIGWLCLQVLPGLPPSLTGLPGSELEAHAISLDPGSTRLTLLNFATYGLFFVLTLQVAADRHRARRMLLALFLVIAAFAVYGLVNLTQLGDTLLGFEKSYYRGSATGTFINRNSFATFLAAGLAIGVPLLIDGVARPRPGQGRRVTLLLLGLLFIAAALLATGSRTGAIAGLVGVLLAFALSFGRIEGTRLRLWLSLGAIAAATVIAVLYGGGTLERLLGSNGDPERSELYRQVWDAILQRPWLGYGGGSFATVFPMFQHAPLAGDLVWDRAHSTYLALWFELGLVAGTLPLVLVAALLHRALRGLSDPASHPLSVAALGVGAVFAIHSLVDFSAEIMADAFLFTIVLALGAARSGDR